MVQSRACLTAPIFTSARACGHQALVRTPSQGTTHYAEDLAGPPGLSCARGASLEETLGEDSPLATSMPAIPATEVQPEDHRNALDGKVLQKTPVLAMAQAQPCTGPASAPKLRQNRFKYRSDKYSREVRCFRSLTSTRPELPNFPLFGVFIILSRVWPVVCPGNPHE